MKESLIGGLEAQSLSGAVMEAPGGVIPLLPDDRAQVPTLREVLVDQPVGVLFRALRPGVFGMGKVPGGAQGFDVPFGFGSLRALVQRERMHPVAERAEEVHGCFPEGGGGKPRQGREQGMVRPAFHGGDADPIFQVSPTAPAGYSTGAVVADRKATGRVPSGPCRSHLRYGSVHSWLISRWSSRVSRSRISAGLHSGRIRVSTRCPSETPIQDPRRSARRARPRRWAAWPRSSLVAAHLP